MFYNLQKRTEFVELLGKLRQNNSKITFTNGCFDILHPGHIGHLQEASTLGDVLIVGLNSDKSIREIKGITRPINKIESRACILNTISNVNHVVEFDEPTTEAILELVRPTVYARTLGNLVESEINAARQLGINVHLLQKFPDYSTTAIIKKINENITVDRHLDFLKSYYITIDQSMRGVIDNEYKLLQMIMGVIALSGGIISAFLSLSKESQPVVHLAKPIVIAASIIITSVVFFVLFKIFQEHKRYRNLGNICVSIWEVFGFFKNGYFLDTGKPILGPGSRNYGRGKGYLHTSFALFGMTLVVCCTLWSMLFLVDSTRNVDNKKSVGSSEIIETNIKQLSTNYIQTNNVPLTISSDKE